MRRQRHRARTCSGAGARSPSWPSTSPGATTTSPSAERGTRWEGAGRVRRQERSQPRVAPRGLRFSTLARSHGRCQFHQADMSDPSATSLTHYDDTKVELSKGPPPSTVRCSSSTATATTSWSTSPLTDYATTNAPGRTAPTPVENFTRTTGFGEDQNHWTTVQSPDIRMDPNLFAVHSTSPAATSRV